MKRLFGRARTGLQDTNWWVTHLKHQLVTRNPGDLSGGLRVINWCLSGKLSFFKWVRDSNSWDGKIVLQGWYGKKELTSARPNISTGIKYLIYRCGAGVHVWTIVPRSHMLTPAPTSVNRYFNSNTWGQVTHFMYNKLKWYHAYLGVPF